MRKVELAKTYEAKKVEDDIYRKWEKSGFFAPEAHRSLADNKKQDYFSIAMPPPNVTGILHLGHAFENALMDIEIRYQRMKGKKALLVPGTDHAAVATQAKVEDELKKQGIKNPRQELGRERLLKKIKKYAENFQSTILSQIRKMGTSCDWSRLAYTFDEKRSMAVYELFKMMYDDGLIYRGYRVVNWSVKGQSTCSDDELVYVDQKTKLYTFRYAKDFPIPIATTRPETKLGDTAVAVNPNDKRYKKYIGQKFTVDLVAKNPLTITIIADKNVDLKYGTGAVGVTPAHSQIDFEIYQKNKNIGLIQVISQDGKMTKEAGPNYQGLTVLAAREKFVKWLKDNKLFIKEEEIIHRLGASDRFGDVAEALPMEQWFVDVNKKIPGRSKSLKDLMREAVTLGHGGDRKKKINITPERFQKIYLQWIDNLRDWNISRQIWWGHRIPIWYCRGKDKDRCLKECKKPIISLKKPAKCSACGSKDLVQDEDTLDTWFSSGAWTFSTLGWPKQTKDLKNFHPTSWMQMGYEILFFWMARMILMSTYALGEIPFKEVYIHGMLRDKNGKKFSKSAGNGFDPLDIIHKYGADALRLSLIKAVTPGNDSRFYEEKMEGARNFVNKLWNISRYVLSNIEEIKIIAKEPKPAILADKWILNKLNKTIQAVSHNLDNFQFSMASEILQEFTWNDFADWYIEISKIEKNKDKILLYILQNILKLWHPFCPFVTEAIWQKFNQGLLMAGRWPQINLPLYKGEKISPAAKLEGVNDFELIKSIITAIRNLRAENKIESAKWIKATIVAKNKKALIESQVEIIKKLARLSELNVETRFIASQKKTKLISAIVSNFEIYLDISGALDIESEKQRLKKELAESEGYLKIIKAKLANQEFAEKAPKNVVNKERAKLQPQQEKLEKLRQQLEELE